MERRVSRFIYPARYRGTRLIRAYFQNGRVSFNAFLRDVTAKRTAGAALRDSEERLRLLADGTRDYGIFMLDPAGRIATWTLGAQRLKGYTEAEAVGQHFSIFYTDQQRADGHPDWELALAAVTGRYEEEAWRVRKDGSRFWASVVITALRDDDGTLRGFGKVTRDITERRMAEQALQASEERFRRAFRDAPIGVCLVDLDGSFLQVNPALAALTGYPLQTLLTMRVQGLTHPDDLDTDSDALTAVVLGELPESSRDQRYLRADRDARHQGRRAGVCRTFGLVDSTLPVSRASSSATPSGHGAQVDLTRVVGTQSEPARYRGRRSHRGFPYAFRRSICRVGSTPEDREHLPLLTRAEGPSNRSRPGWPASGGARSGLGAGRERLLDGVEHG